MAEMLPLTTWRPPFRARRHMVVAGHYLAAMAGLSILEAGGNAVDAGVAAGMCINVTQPDMTSFGGVAPTMIYLAGARRVVTIDGLGRYPAAASIDWFQRQHGGKMPAGSARAVVPAALASWTTAVERYGTMTFRQVAAPALALARDGFPVYPMLRHTLLGSAEQLRRWPSSAAHFMPGGRVPELGELWRQPDLVRTLERLGEAEARAGGDRAAGFSAVRDLFYRGEMARQMVECNRADGGLMALEDLASYQVEVGEPVRSTYRGYEVCACGPWSQGPVLPQLISLLEGFDLRRLGHNTPDYVHTFVECAKLAFSDRHHFYGDPGFVLVPLRGLLSAAYAEERRRQVDPRRAAPGMPAAGDPWRHEGAAAAPQAAREPAAVSGVADLDTSFVCAVDEQGNAFAATPSDPETWTPIVPGLGFAISGRGNQGWLEEGNPSSLAPGKRPRLTPNPAILLRGGEAVMPFGTPGGDVQCQAMAQLLCNVIDFGMDPQEAVEAARFASASFPNSFYPNTYQPGRLNVEARLGQETLVALRERGHDVDLWPDRAPDAGSLCAIWIDRHQGTLVGGADPRRNAYAAGW